MLPAQFRKTVRESSYNNRILCLDKHPRWNCLVGFGLSRKDLEFPAQLDREEALAAQLGKDFDRDDRAQQLYAFTEVGFDDSGRFVVTDHVLGLAKIDDCIYFHAHGNFFSLWNPAELAKMGDTWDAAKAACASFDAEARGRK
ncbi:MAG: division/cell wall cluster transcriptional repressor MraZ [Novosphingobium sp.]